LTIERWFVCLTLDYNILNVAAYPKVNGALLDGMQTICFVVGLSTFQADKQPTM